MYKILRKQTLNEQVKLMEIEAPLIAKKAKAGQFIILRVHENGERIPLTISDYDAAKGTITIIFQEVGKTTMLLGTLEEGDSLQDFVGPLGKASHFPEDIKKAAIIGGGLGTAIAYPQAKELHRLGVEVTSIAGFRNKDLVLLEKELHEVSDKVIITTDDGSNGNKGFVTDALKNEIESGENFDLVIAIGPLIMMKFVSQLTKQYGIKTIVSMNSIMIDGTGMCGGCRVTVAGETKFACVDGPDFDGHEVDFDQAMRRQGMYKEPESEACNLFKGVE
ncbi:sulfide/dihydroorotate dehydrogenase-like FAD/NAD-binding protein [Alkalibacter rhizosphaerae]|uniref:Sulfide/dihydroorotate dehydrogenase-like FAD/NAD-binding protein n=1 Tax=Alkalibacter rhizosphaerae TaxID=2815577 RepID=A0A975AIU9_9FIRM|nr:sulfide/dihydroorotate dehydrogenase-like FAD/NAD-binding protein [Alkalibacter rhizosphaerae]QSX09488.1 sulfide/dihydroorotate dehydrogenase-like FAD/NAD-binding protein [Alkalibacter rhizosphaerae]